MTPRTPQHLMASRYSGKGRPKKSDYVGYGTLEQKKQIEETDKLLRGFNR